MEIPAAPAPFKLLVCDDDCDLIHWLERQLTPRGIDLSSAFNGDEAISIYRRGRPFDLVLTDFQFGSGRQIKNGLELLAAIRDIDARQPLVLQTSDPNLRAPCPILRKPYSVPRLLRFLRKPVQPLLFEPLEWRAQ